MSDGIEKVLDKVLKFATDIFEKNFMFYAVAVGFVLLMLVFFLVVYTAIKGDPFAEPVVEIINKTADVINNTTNRTVADM